MEPNKELEKAIEKKFLTPSKFAIEIEKIVAEEELNYIDAICHYCEMNDIEVESVSKLMSKPLKERLKYDAINLNFMKKTSRSLPVKESVSISLFVLPESQDTKTITVFHKE